MVGAKAQELFFNGRMLCAPAVLTALNQGLGGKLDQAVVNNLTAGLVEGLGGAGCLCGAVAGACMGLGLFLGAGKEGGRSSRRVAAASHELHDAFKAERGSTCCRVLSKKVKHDKKAHFAQCAELSGLAAELACRALLEQRPELAQAVDMNYLRHEVGKKSGLARLVTAVSS
ncbi:MAG: C-GCAxxG-C-C family protein [Deltaproteobacteria bacterium]|nr:C-GCAxxG-C-C family protein [Deltaproteobacteria bacterium]